MNLIGFFKKMLRDYFIIVTGINLAMAFLGMSIDSERSFSYDVFFSPLIMGAIASLPSIVLYSSKELSLKQTLFRSALHLLLLEVTITGFGYLVGLFADPSMVLPNILTVLLVYIFTMIFSLILDRKTAKEINKGLKRLQESGL